MSSFTKIITAVAVLAVSVQARALKPRDSMSVSYDTGYDDGSRSLTAVSCSDGANGLITRYGWETQANVAGFPHIGGFSGVAGWNSDQCGVCYSLTYEGKTIYVLAVDHADSGWNIAEAAMNDLTNGQAEQLGRVDADASQVDVSNCGL